MTATIAKICRHPVKGLNAESLARVALTPGEGLPHDRRFALAHGATRFDTQAPEWRPKTDTQAPEWRPKTQFLMLMRDEKLAQLRIAFDEATGDLTVYRAGKQVVCGKATEPLGRTLIEQFFAGFMGAAARGAPKLLEAPGHMFTDVPEKCLSLINLASVATHVNPETAARDMNVVKALQRGYGHIDMGVYAEVIGGGEIATGDGITGV